jgi:ABC-type transporter Mla MlaB component
VERDDWVVESREPKHVGVHVVVEIGRRSGAGDLAVWCAQIESLLTAGGADVVACDVAHLDGSAGTVIHALVRLQLTARRCGGAIQLFRPPAALLELLRIAGLTDVLPVSDLRGGDTSDRSRPR